MHDLRDFVVGELLQMQVDLREAADVAHDDIVGFGGQNAFCLEAAELGGRVGLIDIVSAGGAAADLAIGDFDELQVFDGE